MAHDLRSGYVAQPCFTSSPAAQYIYCEPSSSCSALPGFCWQIPSIKTNVAVFVCHCKLRFSAASINGASPPVVYVQPAAQWR